MKVRLWPLVFIAVPLLAQSLVDLQNQARNVNFSAADFTRPLKTGTAFPPVCTLGDMFFKNDAPAGMNIYGCTGTNTWSLQTGGGSSSGGSLSASATTTVLTIGGDCSPTTPCNVRFTNQVASFTSSATATVSGAGTSPSGVFVYADAASGRIKVANSGTATLNCDSHCDVLVGSAFPSDSIPLYQWPVTVAAAWDAFQPVFDKRSEFSTAPAAAGSNLSLTVVGGRQTLGYDPTSGLTPTGPIDATGASLTKPNRTVGSNPSGACPSANEVVLSTASGNLYSCLGGTWHSASLQASFNNGGSGSTCSTTHAIVEGQANAYKLSLTGNCTTTSTAPQSGQVLTFLICQDASGGRTFAWPATYHGGMTVGTTANQCSTQAFLGNGTDYYSVTAGLNH